MDNENFVRVKNLIFLGTSHISRQSIEEIEYLMHTEKPDFVALELDYQRFHSLMQKQKQHISIKNIFRLGVKGYIFAVMAAWAEKKLGEYTGIAPGSEMKHAILLAKRNSINIALIDQDIEITLRQLSKSITWKEKLNFVVDIFAGLFSGKKTIEFDIMTVPAKVIIKKLLTKVMKRYPSIYRVLITERNKAMASNLKKLSAQNPGKKILVILGAGHVDGVVKLMG